MATAFLSHIHKILRRNSDTKSLVRLLIKTSAKTKFSCTHSGWMKAQLVFSVALTASIADKKWVRFFTGVYKGACLKKKKPNTNNKQTFDQQ